MTDTTNSIFGGQNGFTQTATVPPVCVSSIRSASSDALPLNRNRHQPTITMKTTIRPFLFLIALIALLSGIALFAAGCKSSTGGSSLLFNTSTNSIENKAYLVTKIAVAKVLEKHPNATPKLQIAADDLLTLEKSELLTVDPLLEIINRLPPDTFKDPNTGLYIEAGILFFSDELGAVAAKNPDQLRAAARGMRRALETFLPKN